MDALPACLYVNYVQVFCQQRPAEEVKSLGTR